MMWAIDVVGIVGMLLVLLAFFMNQTNKWHSDSIIYDSVNSVGGIVLMAYSILVKTYPTLFLNIIWTAVSLRDIVLDVKSRKQNAEVSKTQEAPLEAIKEPGIVPIKAKKKKHLGHIGHKKKE